MKCDHLTDLSETVTVEIDRNMTVLCKNCYIDYRIDLTIKSFKSEEDLKRFRDYAQGYFSERN